MGNETAPLLHDQQQSPESPQSPMMMQMQPQQPQPGNNMMIPGQIPMMMPNQQAPQPQGGGNDMMMMMMMQQQQQAARQQQQQEEERRREDARERADRADKQERIALAATKADGPIFNNAQTVGGVAGGGGGGGGGAAAAAAASASQPTVIIVQEEDSSCCGAQAVLFFVGFFLPICWLIGAFMGCCCAGPNNMNRRGAHKCFWIFNIIFALLCMGGGAAFAALIVTGITSSPVSSYDY